MTIFVTAKIHYNLLNGTNLIHADEIYNKSINEWMVIHERCNLLVYMFICVSIGIIRTALPNMDREARQEYDVVIQAKDMGGHMGGLSGTTQVKITLTDVNDNPPKFAQGEIIYSFSCEYPPIFSLFLSSSLLHPSFLSSSILVRFYYCHCDHALLFGWLHTTLIWPLLCICQGRRVCFYPVYSTSFSTLQSSNHILTLTSPQGPSQNLLIWATYVNMKISQLNYSNVL